MKVNNGKRVEVKLPDYQGLAGLVEGQAKTTLAYLPTDKGERPAAGAEIEADGRRWTIASWASSTLVKGMRVLTIEAAEDAA